MDRLDRRGVNGDVTRLRVITPLITSHSCLVFLRHVNSESFGIALAVFSFKSAGKE
jgi:hypothetical protein